MLSSLVKCPQCGYRSLDQGKSWEGCERRACGYERVLDQAALDAVLARTAKPEPAASYWKEGPGG